jgi:hypothetical protein
MAKQEDQQLFHDAMALHKRYCDRNDKSHECVGQMSVKRGEVCLDCPLCGRGEHHPWRPSLVHQAESIFAAAGVRFQSLNVESQVAVLDKLEQIIGGA